MSDPSTNDARRSPTFTGSFERVVDAKGRFNLPFRFRRGGGSAEDEPYVVTPGADGGLALFPKEEWDLAFQKVQQRSREKEWRLEIRRLSASSFDVSPDGQGRVMVPQELLSKAGIERKVLVVGMGRYMELWNREAFTAAQPAREEPASEFRDEFFY